MRSANITSGQQSPESQYDFLRSDARAASFLLPHQQLGTFTLPNQPADGDAVVLTVNGNAITFTAKNAIGSTPGFIARGASASVFASNFLAALQRPDIASSNYVAVSGANITLLQYLGFVLVGTTITVYQSNNSVYSQVSSFSGSTTTAGNAWTGNTMALYVHGGAYWINGSRYTFGGGNSPTITAPIANPRIDVLTIDTSGVLAITQGAENVSPSVPTYPANKLALCEIYNVTGETSIFDSNNQVAGQGYINNDIRNFLNYTQNPTAFASDLIPDANNTRNLGSVGNQWNNLYANVVFQNGAPVSAAKFGGTGSDGALTISSGTTTLNAGNAAVVTKNFSSISITGTGTYAGSTPNTNGTVVILKSQGAVTLTSSSAPMLDFSGMGAVGGAGAIASNQGNSGNSGLTILFNIGGGQKGDNGSTTSTGGATAILNNTTTPTYLTKHFTAFVGGGGGSGSAATGGSTSGAGGNGGGCLIVECNGAWNFTTASGISVAGKIGGSGTANGGGSGGGGGGNCFVIYTTLTANSGTITVSGGSGSAHSGGGGNCGAAGGGSYSNAGTNMSGSNLDGSAGGNGSSLVVQNTEYS